jgi:hypothetical protein
MQCRLPLLAGAAAATLALTGAGAAPAKDVSSSVSIGRCRRIASEAGDPDGGAASVA